MNDIYEIISEKYSISSKTVKWEIRNSIDTINVFSNEISSIYLKLKSENKDFVEHTIKHLYSMQNRR